MTRPQRCSLLVLAALFSAAVTTAATVHADPSPAPSPAPTPDPSVRMPSSPQPSFAPPAHFHVPVWKQGQSWSVECDYPDQLGARTPPWLSGRQRKGAPHPRFTFTVDRIADAGALRLYSVQVRPEKQDQKTTADLVFAGERTGSGGLSSLFLMKAIYKGATGTGTQVDRRDYNAQAKEPFPVINDVNGIPSDFPMLSEAELSRSDGKLDGVWKEYQAFEALEGDRHSRAVRQTILFASDKMQFGERLKVNVPRAECVDVFMKLLSARGNDTTRLVFHPSYPWPVYGEGPKGRFWLLP